MKKLTSFHLIVASLTILILFACKPKRQPDTREIIDLGGVWQMQLDRYNIGEYEKWYNNDLEDIVKLPGSLDENKKGNENKDTTELHLNRPYKYYGAAWYRKEITIPEDWADKTIELIMERTKVTRVWLDSEYLGTKNNILTKQVYRFPSNIKTGKHFLTIAVDNRIELVPVAGSHAYEDNTQTNWNGIIGTFHLEASSSTRIDQIKVYPDIETKTATVFIKIENPEKQFSKITLSLNANAWNTKQKHVIKKQLSNYFLTVEDTTLQFRFEMGENMLLWSEYNPVLYALNISLKHKNKIIDFQQVNFGVRDFQQKKSQFTINDKTTFLRGKHDACVFPLTGYPPTDTAGWNRVFRIAKSYGINHYRFHSWCPPEAAFLAADVNGIYLQPELPIWWGFNASDEFQYNYMIQEGKNIMDNYGNYASFVMFALGNEIHQPRDSLKNMVSVLRNYDNRHLYAQGSNNWLGNPRYAEGDDFWVTFRTGLEKANQTSDVRGSMSFHDSKIGDGGIINSRLPSTRFNYSKAISKSPVPVIGHEIGQYSMYPNYKEMEKYTGVLKPWNFEIFKRRLTEKGMLDLADDFFRASGALSVICYREDIEMAIRTPGFGGFQLLDLQDFPGQGTALIGIVDAFLDSKGLITPKQFRQFCNEVVILLEMSKYSWTNGDIRFNGDVIVANYSQNDIEKTNLSWNIAYTENNSEIKKDNIYIENISQGKVNRVGKIEFELSYIKSPAKLLLTLSLDNITTSYPIWIYPNETITKPENILITHKLNKTAIDKLINGGKVLLFPNHSEIKKNSVGGQCIPEFWNYRMFKSIAEQYETRVSEGTMGILTNPDHPVFNSFPTEFYTNWQWWPIIKNSRPLILDETEKNYRPIVQVIDNFNRNHKLGLIFEMSVEKGKLLICTADLEDLQVFPEAKQLYLSILNYMDSDKFNPETKMGISDVMNLIY